MKNIALIVGILFTNALFSQNNVQHYTMVQELPNVLHKKELFSQQNKIQSCTVDTIYYTDAKASSQAIKVSFTTGNISTGFVTAYSQLFQGSSNVTVYGFKWFGKSFDPTLTSNPNINVVCEMYAAGTDGLPSGNALASEIMIVDTNSNNLEHDIVFTTPVITSSNYVMVVKNNSANQLFVMSNDETANDGAGESLSGVFYEPLGTWRKSDQIFGFGDFDLLFLPFVQYDITAGFSTPANGCQNVISSFINTSSNHFANPTLNMDVFSGSAVLHNWTYGNGNTDNNVTNGSNIYTTAGNFNITLISTITGWTMTCTDVTANFFTVVATPFAPVSNAPTPVCEYNPASDLMASGGSGSAIYTWYADAGMSTVLGTASPFSSGTTLTDTVYVTITESGCEGPSTMVPVAFDANAIPTFISSMQGSGLVDFTGVPTATTYVWDFGDGNTDNSQSSFNTFIGNGPFNVCLDVVYANSCTNQYCDVVTFTGVEENSIESMIQTFPNPTEDVLNVNFDYFPNNTRIVLFDVYGKYILRTQAQQNNTISLSNLASGIYILSIEENGKMIARKRVIRK